MWDLVQEFVLDSCVCDECAPYVPVSRMLGRTVFVYPFGIVEDAAGKNIQDIVVLGGGVVWNDAAVFGGRMELKILVRD